MSILKDVCDYFNKGIFTPKCIRCGKIMDSQSEIYGMGKDSSGKYGLVCMKHRECYCGKCTSCILMDCKHCKKEYNCLSPECPCDCHKGSNNK